jgi:hypothetical protein
MSDTVFLPFTEYSSTLSNYSDSDQLQAKQYKSIIESELGQAVYERQYPSFGAAADGPLNPNIPRMNSSTKVIIGDKPVDVYKEFWQYKQHAGAIFTDWRSAGAQNVSEDIAVSEMPLYGNIRDPTLVLSNTNNVRNNLQNYGKQFITTTNMLNTEAFINGVSYESGNISPQRSGTKTDMQLITHGNFKNKEDGDLYSREKNRLRVDLPINYANTTDSYWGYINVAYITPNANPYIEVFHEKLKHGTFNLDAIKLTGESCLNKSFNMIPDGFSTPQDVLNDDYQFPPLSNPNYYNKGVDHLKKTGTGSGLYCSANTNYVAMPKNYNNKFKGLDTSINVSPGNNSLTLGAVMSSHLKNFIQNDLYNFNKALIAMHMYHQELNHHSKESDQIVNNIKKMMPSLFKQDMQESFMQLNYYKYMKSESHKYETIFNIQRNLSELYKNYPEVQEFIINLSIFKFGGHSENHPKEFGFANVMSNELNQTAYEIKGDGCFLLLPTLLTEELFLVRDELPKTFSGTVNDINKKQHYDIHNNKNNCITGYNKQDYLNNATQCGVRDVAGKWQQVNEQGEFAPGSVGLANVVPHMFNNPNNLNNDIYNLTNPGLTMNKYGASPHF